MTALDADTAVGELLFQLATDIAILMERVSLLECLAGWPSRTLRDELRAAIEARDIHPQLEGDKTA